MFSGWAFEPGKCQDELRRRRFLPGGWRVEAVAALEPAAVQGPVGPVALAGST